MYIFCAADPGSSNMNSSKTNRSSNEENTTSKAQKTQQSGVVLCLCYPVVNSSMNFKITIEKFTPLLN